MLSLDAMKISKSIRDKKKKMMTSEPEMVGTSPVPDMNAQDIWDTEKKAYIEDKVKAPEKINADETNMDEPMMGQDHAMEAERGIKEAGHVPYHEMDSAMKSHESMAMHPDEGGLDEPQALLSKKESDEKEWNTAMFKRKGRLNTYLNSLDI